MFDGERRKKIKPGEGAVNGEKGVGRVVLWKSVVNKGEGFLWLEAG